MIALELADVIPSLNQVVRMHWAKRSQLRSRYALALMVAMNEARWLPARPAPRMRVVVRSYRKALLDYDNLVGGAKPLLDALRDVGAIRDDSTAWLEVSYEQKIGKPRRTVIELQAEEEKP